MSMEIIRLPNLLTSALLSANKLLLEQGLSETAIVEADKETLQTI